MALTKCKECGGAVAEMAAKCPHCGTGYPAIAPNTKPSQYGFFILSPWPWLWWAYSNGREAKDGLEAYFHFYNTQRPHQALGYRTPAEVFSGDSVQSDEQSKERRWPPSRALVYLGKMAGPSLNIAPMLSN